MVKQRFWTPTGSYERECTPEEEEMYFPEIKLKKDYAAAASLEAKINIIAKKLGLI